MLEIVNPVVIGGGIAAAMFVGILLREERKEQLRKAGSRGKWR